jgi:cytochrome c5
MARAIGWATAIFVVACGGGAAIPEGRPAAEERAPASDDASEDAETLDPLDDVELPREAEGTWPAGAIPASPQRPGDPRRGYDVIVDGEYLPCGIPASLYAAATGVVGSAYGRFVGSEAAQLRLPDRSARNADLPYYLTRARTRRGVEVIAQNCLFCHAGTINGQLVVGLGNAASDFTGDFGALAAAAPIGLVLGGDERAELAKFTERTATIAPFMKTATVGVNPADSFTAALLAHHVPETLSWTTTALVDLSQKEVLPESVPPWWNMSRKTAMFYTGAGRGDHARLMSLASLLCVDGVDDARAIDRDFGDVRAYVASVESPRWPFVLDRPKAARGRLVFERACARCHGTSGDGAVHPNLLVPAREVGTDPAVAERSTQIDPVFVDLLERGFHGETADSVAPPEPSYVAPPLTGIWATAPYLHNGSVPTLAALLDSRRRPTFWARSFDSRDYDPREIGFRYEVLDHGPERELLRDRKARIYDTRKRGYGNGGHTFGDPLADEERSDLLEYLKTL